MSRPVFRPHQINGLILGKINIIIDPVTKQSVPMVYQRVARGIGNIRNLGTRDLQLRTEPPREDAQSEPQLRIRRRIKAAVRAYQALTTEQKKAYRDGKRKKNQTGYNRFIAEFCATHPVEEFIDDKIKIEFYGDARAIARPFSVIKYYILER